MADKQTEKRGQEDAQPAEGRTPADPLGNAPASEDDALRSTLELQLEEALTAEIDRLRAEKRPSDSSDPLPPAPDFRPAPALLLLNRGKKKEKEKEKKEKRKKDERGAKSSRGEADSPLPAEDAAAGRGLSENAELSAAPDDRTEEPDGENGENPGKGKVGRGVSYFFVFLLLSAAIVATFLLLFSLFGKQVSSLLKGEATVPSGDGEGTAGENGADSGEDRDPLPLPSEGDIPSGGFSSTGTLLTVETTTTESRAADGTLLFTVTLDHPKLEYSANPVAEAKIRESMEALSASYEADAAEKAAAYEAGYLAGSAAGSYELRFSSMAAKDGVFTLIATVTVNSGGASPLTTVECGNFSARTGELLSLSDVVSDQAALSALSVSHVDKSLVWEEIYESVIESTVCDSWYPSAEGIVLIYQKYSIGPGASGTIEVLIPYGELDGLLTDRLTIG